MTRAPRGSALLGFFVFVGLVLSAILALLILVSGSRGPGLHWLLGALVFTVASAIALGRSDRGALLKVLLFSTVTPALVLGMWAASSPEPQGTLWGVISVLLLLAAGLGFGLWRELHRPTRLPNLLPEFAPGQNIYESGGLQLCFHVAPRKDGALELQVTLQNCVDQERQLHLGLRSASSQPLAHPESAEVQLGPAEVGLLRVPLHPGPGPGEPGSLYLQPRISGPRGARLRPRSSRSQAYGENPLKRLLTAGDGQLPMGATIPLRLPRLPGPPPPQPTVASEVSWKLLWRRGGSAPAHSRASMARPGGS